MLIREAGADNLVQRSGYHSLRRTQAALDEVAAVAEALAAEFGVRSEIISPAQLAAAEPGLNETGPGAVHWRDPWTVSDPGGLVSAYADLFTRNGGTFVNGDAATLAQTAAGWTVQSNNGRIACRGGRGVAGSMVSRSPAKIRLSFSDASQAWLPPAFQRRRSAQSAAARS